MPNIFHQSIEDILKAATPEQKLLWNYIFLRWGERVPISQIYYTGSLAGVEFGVYSANKIYVCYELQMFGQSTPQITQAYTNLYNEANGVLGVMSNDTMMWDATAAAARFYSNNCTLKNVWFSRIAQGAIPSSFSIQAYRITI